MLTLQTHNSGYKIKIIYRKQNEEITKVFFLISNDEIKKINSKK
jgi:hypothetical protein